MKIVLIYDAILLSYCVIVVRGHWLLRAPPKVVTFWWVCVCDVVVGSCLFFLSLSSVTWHTGWLSHMPWGRVTKLTLGTGRFLEGQTWSCGYSMIRSWLSLDSLSFRYIPHKTLNTWKRDQSHTGSFACFSPLNANCLYCTLLLTMFQSIRFSINVFYWF